MLATSIARVASSRSVAAAAASPSSAASTSSSALSAYLLLSRPPTILRSPTPLESAYYAYNNKVQHALSQPFVREVYYKKGSAPEAKFLKEEEERRKALEGKGSKESMEGQLGSDESGTAASEANAVEGQDLYQTQPRTTKADEENRIDSLERSLDRNLFLLVKGGEMGSEWTLPFAQVDKGGKASLHKAAPEAVLSLLGREMDIWMVSNLPIGLLPGSKSGSEKGYVMRGHILAGQPATTRNGVEFAWLTREEIQERVGEEYWNGLEDLLSA